MESGVPDLLVLRGDRIEDFPNGIQFPVIGNHIPQRAGLVVIIHVFRIQRRHRVGDLLAAVDGLEPGDVGTFRFGQLPPCLDCLETGGHRIADRSPAERLHQPLVFSEFGLIDGRCEARNGDAVDGD